LRGARLQTKPNIGIDSGKNSRTRNMPGRLVSMNGASHSPARKPRITEGSAASTSTVGFTTWRISGDMKLAVKMAPRIASGIAKIIA